MKKIGEFLKEKRNQAGLSLRQASRLSGVSHTHIRDIEQGSSVPSFEMVMGFLDTYRIEIEEFLSTARRNISCAGSLCYLAGASLASRMRSPVSDSI